MGLKTTEASAHSGSRALSTVRELITSAPDVFQAMLTVMQQSEAAGGLIARGRQSPSRQVRSRSRRRPLGRSAPYPFPR